MRHPRNLCAPGALRGPLDKWREPEKLFWEAMHVQPFSAMFADSRYEWTVCTADTPLTSLSGSQADRPQQELAMINHSCVQPATIIESSTLCLETATAGWLKSLLPGYAFPCFCIASSETIAWRVSAWRDNQKGHHSGMNRAARCCECCVVSTDGNKLHNILCATLQAPGCRQHLRMVLLKHAFHHANQGVLIRLWSGTESPCRAVPLQR